MHVSALRVQLQGARHAVSTAVSAGTWDQLGFLTLRLEVEDTHEDDEFTGTLGLSKVQAHWGMP